MAQLTSGHGEAGLAVARQLGHITYLSEDAMEQSFHVDHKMPQEYQYHLSPEFEIESYLNYQGKKICGAFNLYSYLILTKAVSYFDLKRTYGSLDAALGQSKAKFLALSISSDWLYTAKRARR